MAWKKLTFLALLLLTSQNCLAQDEKQVTLYTTYAYPDDGYWHIPLRAWVRENPAIVHRTMTKVAQRALQKLTQNHDISDAQKARYDFRTETFFADSAAHEKLIVTFDGDIDNESFVITDTKGNDKTDLNGLIEGELKLSTAKAHALLTNRRDGWLKLRVVSKNHRGSGWVRFTSVKGTSVISDIDDTIKITQIPEGKRIVLRNTFFETFTAPPCMLSLFRDYSDEVSFHYISGGPWQLYAPLHSFLQTTGFPRGSLHMKSVRTNPFASGTYEDIWKLIANGSTQTTKKQKSDQIGQILDHFPDRKFILIGDSGEIDPEIYSDIRREKANQIKTILIRDIVNDRETHPARFNDIQILNPDHC